MPNCKYDFHITVLSPSWTHLSENELTFWEINLKDSNLDVWVTKEHHINSCLKTHLYKETRNKLEFRDPRWYKRQRGLTLSGEALDKISPVRMKVKEVLDFIDSSNLHRSRGVYQHLRDAICFPCVSPFTLYRHLSLLNNVSFLRLKYTDIQYFLRCSITQNSLISAFHLQNEFGIRKG